MKMRSAVMTSLPRQLLKDYKALYLKLGHDEAYKILRQRITNVHGRAWFMTNRLRIESEIANIEKGGE